MRQQYRVAVVLAPYETLTSADKSTLRVREDQKLQRATEGVIQ